MQVAFRTDASLLIGTGHVMRCLTLASVLRQMGATCTFFCRSQPRDMCDAIASQGHEVCSLPPLLDNEMAGPNAATASDPPHAYWLGTTSAQDAQDMLCAMEGRFWDWLVVDHYALDVNWEQSLRGKCSYLMVLDDLADRDHDCDLLVDPGIVPDLLTRYVQRVPKEAALLVGPQYALLRPEFDFVRAEALSVAPPATPVPLRRLLVMFGGNDAVGHTLEALEAIATTAPVEIKVDVVVSPINQDQTRLTAFCAIRSNFSLHVASNEVAKLMARADLVVASGGGATYERLYLRRPSLIKVVAENQRKPLQYMANIGLFSLYSNRIELEMALRQAFAGGVTSPPDIVRNGVSVITRALLQRLISLQAPRPFDLRRSFSWLQDIELRQQFLMRGGVPTRSDHFQYWRRLLFDAEQHIFSIYQGLRHVGNAGLRDINKMTGQAELWLYIGSAKERGKGLGKLALQQLENMIRYQLGCHTAVLHVSRLNIPAFNLYCHSGYSLSDYQDSEAAGFAPGLDVVRMEKLL